VLDYFCCRSLSSISLDKIISGYFCSYFIWDCFLDFYFLYFTIGIEQCYWILYGDFFPEILLDLMYYNIFAFKILLEFVQFSFYYFLLAYIKLYIVRSFIMTFPYMHIMYFDHINTLYYSFLSSLIPPPFPLPFHLLSSFTFDFMNFLKIMFCFVYPSFQMTENMWYLSLCDWLISHNTVIYSFIHFPANDIISIFLMFE
jgi:hypothetical protein